MKLKKTSSGAVLLAVALLSVAVVGCSPDAEPEPVTTEAEQESAESPAEPATGDAEAGFTVSSAAFADGEAIPATYCLGTVTGGTNTSIPLVWSGAPDGTASFVVAMIDTHPVANDWVHWIVIDLPASTTGLQEGASGTSIPDGADELESSFGEDRYGGPAPPPGSGDHTYVVTVYALDTATVVMSDQPSAADIESALEGHVLASASITGVFGR